MPTKAEVVALQQEITRLTNICDQRGETIVKLEKELAQAKTLQTHYLNSSSAYQAEVSSVHAFLDAVPNPPARKMENGYSDHPIMTRLAVWMATRSNGGGF